jgi:hypothetical protein
MPTFPIFSEIWEILSDLDQKQTPNFSHFQEYRQSMQRTNNTNKHISTSEAMAEYSEVFEFLGWDKRILGTFCQARVLNGKYNNTLKEWVFNRSSLDVFIDFMLKKWEQSIRKHRVSN